ncbi:glycoside hydrolase family 1 protein [Patescibacteria group bacterium]|nr:glycoside hydrolase family 1 protein [Patescibacteria group bacterium]
MTLQFPKGFLWGSATSAYQVEGGIENNDWAKVFPAGKACDHYNRYEEDFELVQQLNQNAHRFSLEWSRIEPQEGVFDKKEIEHYRRVLQSLKQKNISTMVTLHHFTTPLWLAEKGGWANSKTVFYFSRFAQKMFEEYHNLVDFWITINEPTNYATIGYLQGRWAPNKHNPVLFLQVVKNLIAGHKAAYQKIHDISSQANVGVAKGYVFFEGIGTSVLGYLYNNYFLNKIQKQLDFIGLNYYFHSRRNFLFLERNENNIVSDINWEIYPKGLYHVLKDAAQYNLPLYITENGLSDAKDKLREDFIKNHVTWMHKAISEGVNCKGYFHWSLLDNFEWEKGFEPRFGLIEIDYKTFKRTPRASAKYYAHICKTNQLES